MLYEERTLPPSATTASSRYGNDDYRILAVEKWYEHEISRHYRKLEFQVEVRVLFYYFEFFLILLIVSLVNITF